MILKVSVGVFGVLTKNVLAQDYDYETEPTNLMGDSGPFFDAPNESYEDEFGSGDFRRIKDVGGFHNMIPTNLSVKNWLHKLRQYGCHCFGADASDRAHLNHLTGSGPPVDAIDQACRDLKECRRCIKLEFPDFASILEAVAYVGRHTIDVDQRYNWNECDYASKHNSKFGVFEETMQTCECDLQFMRTMADIWISDADTPWNEDNYGDNFTDRATVCVSPDKDNAANACCGDNPFSRPFNDNIFECCNDGRIELIGAC